MISQTARKEEIKGSWVAVVKRSFPSITYKDDDDTPTGLLRFIKSYFDKTAAFDIEETDMRNYILNAFPALPLSLFRILECTQWMRHSAFSSFYETG